MRHAASLLFLSLLAARGGPAVAGETACWFENGAVVAPAAIGGIAGDYVIDLSAPRTLLHIDVAQRAGFTETALTLPVRLAGQEVAGAPVAVQDLDYRAVGFSTPIVGVIGADILDRYGMTLDFSPCRLRLERPGRAMGGRDGSLPVTMVGGVPTILAAASNGLKGVSGPFALDTASAGGVRARGAADGPRQKPAGTLSGLSLDGTLRQDLPAVVAGDLPDGVVGALGVQVLAAYRLRLDPKALRLWLTPVPAAR
ncbi:hypothetical protein [Caulobacter sp. UNC279MFTsu5.1]|uniref:hypothetical protein n=1 Tax=Caulobacter sp. UNC279MFTsu5.1 TaxID=1502775 RepID=UPI0008EBA429|nr:hypothetical protein [Caulobacter sp. UNC279MFTsu5.1]SFJ14780.1 hypothetical protein SAMN02799626_01195 [Caulobacter sp. UNC279MFTsu5.1]